jgi:molybdate transport system substrate-binding protein
MNKFLLWAVISISIVSTSSTVRSAEVTLIAPGGIRAAVDQMIPAFEKATGHKVKATFGSGGGTKERVIKGEPFDVPIVQLPLEPVIASGHVVAASETPLALVAVGVAVRTGTPKPDISSADAVKRLLLGSKAIAYPNAASGAAAGISFNETLQKLGIADAMKPKIKLAQGGRGAMELLAKGEVGHRPDFHQRDHHRTRGRGRRPAAARHFDADGSRGLCICTHKGPRRRASAAALFVLSRSCGGL